MLAVTLAALLPTLASAAPVAANMLLLDAAIVGDAVVAVGERGTILRSFDHATTWTAATAPASTTLTGVSFADGRRGWAVGHDALILSTNDGAATWAKQWQGENLSDSFLDVLALDENRVLAVGAYGLFCATNDAGKTWTRRKVIADDYHLNRISRGPTGTLYLAGEHGTLLRSTDAGVQWAPIPTPYDGSFYGILPLGQRTLLAYGLRGRAYRSTDDGKTWAAVLTGKTALLATAIERRDKSIVIGGQIRALLVSSDAGETFAAQNFGTSTGIAELIELPNGELLTLGEAGAQIARPTATAAQMR